MYSFFLGQEESFSMGESNLSALLETSYKLECGVILFCREGEANLSVESKQWEIHGNTIIVLIPDTILTLNGSTADFKVRYLAFSRPIFAEAVFRLDASFFWFLKKNPCHTHLDADNPLESVILRLFWMIYQEPGHLYQDVILKNQLQCFFLHLYDRCYQEFSAHLGEGGSRADEIFHQFINSVHTHCVDQKEVAFYANELCVSPRYLSAVTRQVAGESAKVIIDRHIILEIKVLLRTTELSVQEITTRLNFPNQSYLGRFFKKHTGESPIAYRNKRRQMEV